MEQRWGCARLDLITAERSTWSLRLGEGARGLQEAVTQGVKGGAGQRFGIPGAAGVVPPLLGSFVVHQEKSSTLKRVRTGTRGVLPEDLSGINCDLYEKGNEASGNVGN